VTEWSIAIDTDSPVPPFAQIREGIEMAVSAGALAPGDPLPPVRQLAGDLRVAAGTVQRAYRLLAAAGVVEARSRRGVVVAERPAAGDRGEPLRAAAQRYVAAGRLLGVSSDDLRAALDQALAAPGGSEETTVLAHGPISDQGRG
jgi:GntR family transcriptional regulator